MILKIDLRRIRAESERNGEMKGYALKASELSMDIEKIVKKDEFANSVELSKYVFDDKERVGKKDAAQIIDSIIIGLTSLGGFSGLSLLILKIINAAKKKIPTTYEVEMPNVAKIKISGPNISNDNVGILEAMISQLKNACDSKETDAGGERVILICPQIEE